MSTIDNIISLLKEQKKTQKELCDYLGITKNAFTDWKNGRIKSYNKHLPQIAAFFGTSVDYLLGNTDKKEKLSAESEELSEYLEKLRTDENYRMMFSLMKGATKEDVEKAVRVVKSLLGEE